MGSGRDEVEIAPARRWEWKAGVVGALDGLRIKITSPVPTIQATLTAGSSRFRYQLHRAARRPW